MCAGWAEEQKDRWPGRAWRNGRATKVLPGDWTDFSLMTLQLQSAPALHFQHKNCLFERSASESSQSDQLITKCCQNTSWRIFANAVFPCLGRFHLELPQYLRSFLECGKEVWWHHKWSSSAWQIHRFREHSSPGSRSQPQDTATKSPFLEQTDKHLLAECQKQEVECPNHEVSTLQQLLMNLHSSARPGDRCSVDRPWSWAAAGSPAPPPWTSLWMCQACLVLKDLWLFSKNSKSP